MKTMIWVITTLAVMYVANSYATGTSKMNIVQVEAEKALVAFESASPAHFEITIKKEDGRIVYYKETKDLKKEYRQVFDFSETGPGTYDVCICDGSNRVSRKMVVSKNGISVEKPLYLTQPYFKFENNRLNVSFLNHANKSVYLSIYQGDDYVTSVKLGKDVAIQKCIDFSKLKKGDYEVVLNDWYNDYSFIVHK
jgi:hypothetical protein